MKNSIWILPALILLGACQKNKPQMTTVKGQVRTYGTAEAIKHPPVKVQIVEHQRSTTWGSADNYEPVAETWSDENASFSLSHELDPEEDYFLAVEESTVKRKHHYLAPVFHYERHKINTVGGTVNLNYYLSAYGWVEFNFFSEDPQPGDEFWYNVGGGGHEVFYGSVDAYRTWDFAGNHKHHIAYIYKSNGERHTWQEDILVPPFDTIPHEVRF